MYFIKAFCESAQDTCLLKWVRELTNGSWTLSIWEFLQQLTIKCPWRNASPIIVTNCHKLSTSKLGKRFRHCDVLIQRDAVSSFVPEWECPKDLHTFESPESLSLTDGLGWKRFELVKWKKIDFVSSLTLSLLLWVDTPSRKE